MWQRLVLLGTLVVCPLEVRGALAAGPRPIVERPWVVAIDPGHGGTNVGCLGAYGVSEKDVTLTLARELRDALRARLPHVEVVLTRDDDEGPTLAQRVARANAAGADLLLSLHTNASPTRTQRGFETYVLDAGASTLEAARIARRENDGGLVAPTSAQERPEIAGMVRELELTAQRTMAARLAQSIQASQAARFPGRSDRGVKQAPFDVLMGARMPAVLFEAGFLDHPYEGALLLDPRARARIVGGLVEAIVADYRERSR